MTSRFNMLGGSMLATGLGYIWGDAKCLSHSLFGLYGESGPISRSCCDVCNSTLQ